MDEWSNPTDEWSNPTDEWSNPTDEWSNRQDGVYLNASGPVPVPTYQPGRSLLLFPAARVDVSAPHAGYWPNNSQTRANTGPTLVKHWSKTGQKLVNHWSNTGRRSLLPLPAARVDASAPHTGHTRANTGP
jgi:hypothetical protein